MIAIRAFLFTLTVLASGVVAKISIPSVLRGSKDRDNVRELLPHPSGGHHSSYQGCLAYSEYQLSQMWTFPGTAPSCSWYNDNTGGGGGSSSGDNESSSSSDSGGGSSSGNNGSSSSSGSGGGSSSGSNGSSSSSGSGSGGSSSGSSGGGGESSNGDSSSESGSSTSDAQQKYEDVSDANNGGGGNFDPFSDFDIAVCESYENLWRWDLSMSCDESLIGCNCTFASELMYDGLLSCEDALSCPEECQICSTCMSLLGCSVSPDAPLASEFISSKILLYLIAAGVALVIIMLAAYYSRRHKDRQDLKASLMAEDNLTKLGAIDERPGVMYINGDIPWKPRVSRGDLTEQTLQPISTMSTTTSRSFFEGSRIQTFGAESLLGKDNSASDSNAEEELSRAFDFAPTTSAVPIVQTECPGKAEIVSPISTPGASLKDEQGDDELENSDEGLSMLEASLEDEN